ncbi:hypothetical protein GCM10011409_19120 [Lentibacillus populi]|uniref:Transglycosylase SLT domain-containing protein n=1 Tax=Lentibacillus populi TaxID=1827502 RepID=A0A9W5TXF7_9BACI|nr:tape measure protein [Lentibacillus populi]GGB41751.1 hypothetical protein GCM10011409_19120 [Lentibacillus populi]
MATIRELQASFVAKVSGMKSAIQGVKKDINSLESSSGKTAGKMSTNFSSVGKTLTNFGNGLQQASQKVGTLGKSLTKKITLPAAGAATAIGGITAALGWKRLVGLDSAQAQLKGLGYNTKEVGRISKQVTKAIDGGMTTMAEGTSVAAGALAAGVKEGSELERYIKLVGDAAVGANRPVGDMAQIFNRVQGSGKLMTQELNMIEDGMPGFAQAMAKNLGVSQEEFRKMVTAGEVNSKQFLDVMEDFAGGMASAYSDSWQGMVANTKAYIGIIGENLLGGVFEKSKESIAEFIEFLKSDEVVAWAQKVGKQIGVMFSLVVDKVQSAIQWFANLSKSQQSMIMKFGAVALAAGPILVVLGTLGGIIGKLSAGLGTLITPLSKAKGVFGLLSITAADGTKKVGLLSRTFTLLTGPVGITIGIIAALVTGFIIAYKKSETFRNFVNKLKDAFVNAYKKVKEFLTTNESFLGFVDSVKSGIRAVVDFFKNKFAEMKAFWDSNGQQLLQAVSNVFKGIWAVIKPIIDAIVSVIKVSLPIIQGIFKVVFWAVLEIVKSVWGNIKGVINGALNVIMGIIKVFSGLFTGDFSKMWEGIKQVFSGALQFIWNFVQLMFWGKLLKGVVGFVKGFSKPIASMWTTIKDLFSRVIKWIVEFVKNRFTAMRNTVSSIFKVIQNVISTIWNAILSFFKMIIKSIVDFIKSRFTNMKNNVSSIFTGIKNIAKKSWNAIKDHIVNPIKSGVKWAIDKFQSFKTTVSNIFKNIKDTVFNRVKDMVEKIKGMPGTMKKGLEKGAGKLKDGMLSLARKMVDGIKNGVNGVITGVNWVLNKLKVPKEKQLNKGKGWDPKNSKAFSWYAHGTKGHPEDGPAVVGDGKGSNAGPELITTPDGKQYLSPDKPTLVPDMPKGTQVLAAKFTRKLLDTPQYAWGTDAWNKVKSGAKKTGSAIKKGAVKAKDKTVAGAKKVAKWTGNIWDYVKHPGKLLNIALEKVGVSMPSGTGSIIEMAKGAFKKVKSSAVDFIKDKLKNSFDFGSGNYSGNLKKWISEAITATGVSGSWAGPLATIAMKESGGRTGPATINKWDSNWRRGTPSMGVMQTIKPTFDAYKKKGMNDIMNPVHNIVAAINYIKSRYGTPWNTPGIKSMANGGPYKGYKDGAFGITRKQLAWIADGGWAESIISHDPAKRVSQERIWKRTGDHLGFTNEKENNKPTEFTQNLTINSPKALSPSEISRKNLQSLRRMALEWGL